MDENLAYLQIVAQSLHMLADAYSKVTDSEEMKTIIVDTAKIYAAIVEPADDGQPSLFSIEGGKLQ